MKGKLTLISALSLCAFAGALAACGETASGSEGYTLAAAYAKAADLGYGGSEEAFYTRLSAAGSDTIASVELNGENEVIVTLADGTRYSLGKIACEHAYSRWQTGAAATCTSLGYDFRECLLCGDKDYDFKEATGHMADEYVCDQSSYAYAYVYCSAYLWEEHAFDEEKTCKECGYVADYSVGLTYKYLPETNSYAVAATGACKDDVIIVPSQYKNRSVTEIAAGAFSSAHFVTEIVLPDTITEIGERAFEMCERLQKIAIPEGVTVIRRRVFAMDRALEHVTLPHTVKTIEMQAFVSCASLTEFTLPDAITEIGSGAFAGCRNLTKINLPQSLQTIETQAFVVCGLTELELPAGLKTIGSNAFRSNNFRRVEIPHGITVIEENVFYGCNNLEEVVLPANITEIKQRAFNNCRVLRQITFPQGLRTIGRYAFASSGLTSVAFPASVTEIGEGAFSHCKLTQLELPATITSVKSDAFANNQSLTRVTVGCSAAGSGIFANCKNLASVVLTEGISVLSAGMFYGCESLTELVIPQSVATVQTHALFGCLQLKQIVFRGTAEEWKTIEKESEWIRKDNIISDLSVICSDKTLEYIW